MSTLSVILLVVLILCLGGGGYGWKSGAVDGSIPGLLYLILVIGIIIWLLRSLGVV